MTLFRPPGAIALFDHNRLWRAPPFRPFQNLGRNQIWVTLAASSSYGSCLGRNFIRIARYVLLESVKNDIEANKSNNNCDPRRIAAAWAGDCPLRATQKCVRSLGCEDRPALGCRERPHGKLDRISASLIVPREIVTGPKRSCRSRQPLGAGCGKVVRARALRRLATDSHWPKKCGLA